MCQFSWKWRDETLVWSNNLGWLQLTLLDVSQNNRGNEGIKLLCTAFTSSTFKLSGLNARHNRVDDKGINYLWHALTDTNCKLGILDLRSNSGITVQGRKYLCHALTGSDWKMEGLKLFRSSTKWGICLELSPVAFRLSFKMFYSQERCS